MQQHLSRTREVPKPLIKKSSEYSLKSKHDLDSINRHKHSPHWKQTFIISNL